MTLKDNFSRLGRVIAYSPVFAYLLGNHPEAALLLCQLLFWKGKEEDRDGWIRKSQNELWAETSLTRSRQESARHKLCQMGFIEEIHNGKCPPKIGFRLNIGRIKEELDLHQEAQGTASLQNKKPKSRRTQRPNPTSQDGANQRDNMVQPIRSNRSHSPDQSAPFPHNIIGRDDAIEDSQMPPEADVTFDRVTEDAKSRCRRQTNLWADQAPSLYQATAANNATAAKPGHTGSLSTNPHHTGWTSEVITSRNAERPHRPKR